MVGDVGQGDLAAAWRATAELFAQLGHPLEEARARARLAEVLRASGDTEAARREADAARAVAKDLGADGLLAALGEAGRTAARRTDALTPREQEILGLVTEGRSNADIGRQLFISAKTVSVHVSNLMAKLGVASRTEAAAVARRDGLLDPSR